MLSSVASQTSIAPPAPAVDLAVDRLGPMREAKSEAMRIEEEMQSWGPLTTRRCKQAAAASRNEVKEARSAGSWDLRPGPLRRSRVLTKKSSQEVALERKKQFEAVCPLSLEVDEVLAAPSLASKASACQEPVCATKPGAELDPQAVAAGRRKQLRAFGEQKAIILVPRDHWRNRGEVEAGRHRVGTRKQRRLFRGFSPAEGSTFCCQLGGVKRKETRVLRRSGGFRARTDG